MAKKVPVEEFKKKASAYIDASDVVHLTRNGRVIGVYMPLPIHRINWERFDKAAAEVERMFTDAGLAEEDIEALLRDFEQERRLKKAG